MKWSRSDYEAMIGLRKKKTQKKKPTSRVLNTTKALLHSMMLAKLLGRDNKNAQQKRAIAAMLSKSNMNGMGRLWKKFLNSKYPLPPKQIKQLIQDKKLIDSFFDARIPLNTRRRIVVQEGGFLGFLLPLITKVAAPLVSSVAHKLFGSVAIVGGREHELQDQLSRAQIEFECLIGKKQSQAVQEAPTKKLSSPRRNAKPKKASSTPRRKMKPKKASSTPRRHATSEKWERTRKAKSPDREKTQGKQVKQSGVRKKCPVQDEEQDPWAWGKNQTSTEIQKWGESEPSPKKSKKENAEKYFNDVPKKKMKVSRLMKFMDKNKDYIQVGDDFEILIRNRPIPSSDFIEIMNYLQKGPEAKVHTFIPTRDQGTGMPVGTR